MHKDEIISKILQALESQPFVNWYTGQFEDFITGDMAYNKKITNNEAKELIEKDIVRLFGLD